MLSRKKAFHSFIKGVSLQYYYRYVKYDRGNRIFVNICGHTFGVCDVILARSSVKSGWCKGFCY